MPIDINLFREEKNGNPEIIRESERRRGRNPAIVNEVIELDRRWRREVAASEKLQKALNAINKEIGQQKKVDVNIDCEELVKDTTDLKQQVASAKELVNQLELERDRKLKLVGNILHPSVVKSDHTQEGNEILRTWNTCNLEFDKPPYDGSVGKLRHHEIMLKLNIVNFKKGVELAGHRGYILKGLGVQLNQALISLGLTFLRRKGYVDIQPPFFMKREIMTETAELDDFSETLYKIPDSRDENEDLFLIATSEQPISALHRKEYLQANELPLKYAGFSSCFRKEAGSHGKDMWGIFRIHQFEKVEQFVITTPEDSVKAHEEMIETAEQFYQMLKLPYRVVSISPDDLNNAASKKYDLEAWFPGYGDFRELVSCSNCTDYQSRALSVRLGYQKTGEREKKFVHMLNATLVATERVMTCILENYQDDNGVHIPEALWPYFDDGLRYMAYPK